MASPTDIETSYKDFMMTRRGSFVINKDMVVSPDADLDTVMDYADELDVSLSGLNTVEEMRIRICMHLDYMELKENPIEKVLKLLSEKQTDDYQRRKKLRELLSKFKDTNSNFNKLSATGRERIRGQATLESLLQTEGITKDLVKDLTIKTQYISSGQCVVVVAGETNAGKSTFLNLLLGEKDLLTVKAVCCTSVITRISYGTTVSVSVLYESGKKEDVPLKPGIEVNKQVEKLLYKHDLTLRETTEIVEVHLKIPSKILKCGLVLVDSPGIGENPVMDSVIKRFVANNEIHGFIYLIKSNSGSRVDEDRLGDLLKMIITTQKEKKYGGALGFDPRLALFICNHWDDLKSERDEVFQYIVTKLEKFWPGLKTDQVIKFSALEARRELNQNENYITPDYKALWEGIHELFVSTLDKRVTSTYKWMETILKRMTHHLKTFVHRLDSSEEGLQEKLSQIELKLQRLNSQAENVFKALSDKIDKASEEIFQSFKQHLMTHPSRTGIIIWEVNETPDPQNFSSWDDVKMEIYEMTSKKMSKELVRWEEKQGHIRDIEKTIAREINNELKLLNDELSDVDDELNSDCRSITSNDSECHFGTLRKRNSIFGQVNLPNMMVDTESTDNQLSVSLIAQILSPLGNALQSFVRGKNRMGEYMKHRTRVTREKSERYYNYLLNTPKGNDFLRKFVDNLLEQSREKLSDIRDKIPAIIKANREVMDHILRCRNDTNVSIELYEEMMHGLEDLKQQLTEYGEGEIFVDDFRHADIRISNSINRSSTQTIRISNFIEKSLNENNGAMTGETRALWTILHNGTVRKEEEREETSVFIRIYMTSSGVTNITSEVSKLRFLKHQHVAEFLGLHRADVGFPALIYKNKMQTLRKYLKSRNRDGKERVRIFQETVKGLEYLHRRRLVHMELNTHTVTLDHSTEKVTLTGACLPRKANLPMDRESVEVSHFVFISPEVLNDEAYLSCDDAYAAGLLALELIFKIKPYKEYRTWSLDQFARELNPPEMLKLDETLQGQPREVYDVMTKCFGKADDRPQMEEFMRVKFPIIDRMRTVEEENPTSAQRFDGFGVPSRI